MAKDSTKVLRFIFRADADAAKKALKDFDGATKSAEATLSTASRKMTADLEKVEASAKKAAASQKGLGGLNLSGGLKGITAGDLKAAGSNSLAGVAQGAIQSQFGGSEALLSGVSNKAIIATGAVVGLGAAAATAGKLSVDAFTGFADKVDAVQDAMGGTAEAASALVNVAAQWGVSSDTLAASEAKLAQNIAGHRDQLAQLGVQVAVTKDGNTDLIATTANVADAFNATDDPVQKAAIGVAAYGKSWLGMVDVLELGGDAIRRAGEAAKNGPKMSAEDLATSKEFKKQMTEVRQSFEAIGVDAGRVLVPALTKGLVVTDHMVQSIHGLISVDFSLVSGLLGVLSHLPAVGGKFDEARDAIDGARDSMNRAVPPAEDTSDAFAGAGSKASEAAGKVMTLSQALSGIQSTWVELHFAETNAIDAQDKYAGSLAALDDLSARAAEGVGSVGKAAESAAKQVADAQKAIDDANQGLAEAITEQARTVEDANRRMVDAEESTAKKIVDAQQKIIDARERADRSMRDATRRLEDARQAAADAQVNSLTEEDPYRAARAREEVAKDLTRAEQDFADAQKDTAKSLADAQDDLAAVETRAVKDRQEAQRQYADALEGANKRVADAQDRVDESGLRMTQTLGDAAKAQEEAGRKAGGHAVSLQDVDSWSNTLINNTAGLVASMLARGASWDEIKGKIDGARARLAEAEQKFGDVGYSAEVYTGILLGIPTEVMTTAILQLDSSQYKRALADAASTFTNTMTQSYVSLGVLDVPGATYNLLPQLNRDSGGPLPPGSSIVHNLSGQTEWVATAAQMRELGGGAGPIINLNIGGSVIAEKDLASMLARIRRNGYNTGGN